jgi:FAD/FMN-containing dehydrogenase/Fe-S oxidoreductase
VDPTPRKRLQDLKGIVRGELLFDDIARALYSTDASPFEVAPAGVVVPRDEADLQALVRYAAENGLALVSRGAGTGLTGAVLGAGLVVDLSRHFREVLEVGAETVRVQAGVNLRALRQVLAAAGRRWAPDPAAEEASVGGMLASNASGPRARAVGTARDHVASMRVVLDSGDVAEVARHGRWPAAEAPHGRLEDIVSATATLLEHHRDLIAACRAGVALDRCGYALHGALDNDELDLTRLLVGSEGTLALITEATLHTRPLPGGQAGALLAFARMEAALRGAQSVLVSGPVACELVDRRLLRLARGDPAVAELVPEHAEAALLVEHEADSPEEARRLAEGVVDRLARRERLAVFGRVACGPAELERLRLVRDRALPELYVLRGAAQPVAVVEDVAVPPEQLSAYLPRVQDVLRRQEVTAAFLIDATSGQVQMRPFLDLQRPADAGKLWALADEVHALVLQLGGTISARHGTGLARMPWVARQVGPLIPVLRELKAIFDPRYLFNPGKVIPPPDAPPTWPLRQRGALAEGEVRLSLRQPEVNLSWLPGDLPAEAQGCNGCGACRTEVAPARMCPIFRATHDEAATPRAKANLMRFLLQPEADPRLLASDEAREVADLCVNCKMCASECPARVDVPKMMLELKAANVARHGLARGDWVLARSGSLARLGSAFAPVANVLLANPLARWLLERLFGVSRRRRLPRFSPRSFLRQARQRGWTRRPRSARPRVAYFVDVYANYNDPLIAESVVAVLHHNGHEVYVPEGQVSCGMAPLTYGDVEGARETVQRNLRVLADLAREGFPILCSEPTAALMLRHDALDLLDDADARLVAAQTVEFTAFLWDLHQQGLLRTDFHPLEARIGHHVPCHLKALGRPAVGPALLSLVPGLEVRTIDVSCSGMAGTFGFRSDAYETSLQAGRPMLEELARPCHLFGSTECSACRLQMEDGTGKRTLHPAQYLALAYGLVPRVLDRLREPIGQWVLQ